MSLHRAQALGVASAVNLTTPVHAHGYQVVWTPFAELLHKEVATRGTDQRAETAARFLEEQASMRRRWGAQMERDPYLNADLQAAETCLVLDVSVRPGHGSGAFGPGPPAR